MRTLIAFFVFALVGQVAAQTDEAGFSQWEQSASLSAQEQSNACQAGDAAACGALGFLVLNGKVEPQDLDLAANLLATGCQGGFGWPCYDLGAMFQQGVGVEKDLEEAFVAYTEACRLNVGVGCRSGAHLLVQTRDERQIREAIRYYYHGCFERHWNDAEACGYFASWATKTMTGDPKIRRHVFLALEQQDKLCQEDDGGCLSQAESLCVRGDGDPEFCAFAIDKNEQRCKNGDSIACGTLLRYLSSGHQPRARDRDKVLAAAARRSSVDWPGVARGACTSDSGSGQSCVTVYRACAAGVIEACAANVARFKDQCVAGLSLDRLAARAPEECEGYVVAALLGGETPAEYSETWDFVRGSCGVVGDVCLSIANMLAGLPNLSTGDAAQRAAAKAPPLYSALCELENPAGCVALAKLTTDETERWAYLNTACRGRNSIQLDPSVPVPYAKARERACHDLGRAVLDIATTDAGQLHADALISRARAYFRRACSFATSQSAHACKSANASERDMLAANIGANASTLASAQNKIKPYVAIDGKSMGGANREACVYYLTKSSEASPFLAWDAEEIKRVCATADLRSYCHAKPPVDVFGTPMYSCGNLQCMRDALNEKGRFARFDRFRSGPDELVKACLTDASSSYLSENTSR